MLLLDQGKQLTSYSTKGENRMTIIATAMESSSLLAWLNHIVLTFRSSSPEHAILYCLRV